MTQRLSPLHQKHLANKATMSEYAGWLQPEKYSAPDVEAENAIRSVGLRDISPLEKLDLKGSNIDPFLDGVLGVSGPPGAVSICRDKASEFEYVCRLTKNHALAIGQENGHAPTRAPLDVSTYPTVERCYLTRVTSVFAGLNLLGPSAPDLLSELTQLDVTARRSRDGWVAEGGLAKVRAVVIRSDLQSKGQNIASFDIFFGRDYAEYLWDTIMEVGSKYSIAPFGVAARRLIQGARGMTK